MSDLWYLGSADPWAYGGWTSPDPVTTGSSGWTWDVEFETSSSQWTYARTSLNTFINIGGGTAWLFSGIVAYRTRNADGSDTVHSVGQSNANGIVDFMNDVAVDSVTFGWGIEGDGDWVEAHINMEIWVTG
jgi:hypothetical protein